MNAHFAHLLHSDRGYFSRAEAIDCGETDRALATARREGMIVRLRRGMYAPADVYNSSDDAGKHLLHAKAALAAQRGPVALTGPSAAALYGLRSIRKIFLLSTWSGLIVVVHIMQRRSTIML